MFNPSHFKVYINLDFNFIWKFKDSYGLDNIFDLTNLMLDNSKNCKEFISGGDVQFIYDIDDHFDEDAAKKEVKEALYKSAKSLLLQSSNSIGDLYQDSIEIDGSNHNDWEFIKYAIESYNFKPWLFNKDDMNEVISEFEAGRGRKTSTLL